MNSKNLDSVGRLNIVYGDTKHEPIECPWQMNSNIIRRTQSDVRVKILASNSSLMKCSNVYSKETPSEQNIPSRSLGNKENEI
ncbi:hypothetical protein TNCV_2085481 [Trichonephila clavipes]|nr:hypothetical protein TNCV_2085481 [Trichonephila clavipes]